MSPQHPHYIPSRTPQPLTSRYVTPTRWIDTGDFETGQTESAMVFRLTTQHPIGTSFTKPYSSAAIISDIPSHFVYASFCGIRVRLHVGQTIRLLRTPLTGRTCRLPSGRTTSSGLESTRPSRILCGITCLLQFGHIICLGK